MPLRELRVERVDFAERRGLPAPCGRPGGGRGCRVEDEEDGEEDAAKGSWVLRSAARRVHPSARGSAEPRATGAVRRVQWPVLPMRAAVEVGALREELALCERPLCQRMRAPYLWPWRQSWSRVCASAHNTWSLREESTAASSSRSSLLISIRVGPRRSILPEKRKLQNQWQRALSFAAQPELPTPGVRLALRGSQLPCIVQRQSAQILWHFCSDAKRRC